MYTEIKEAINFLGKHAIGRIPRRVAGNFCQDIANFLVLRCIEHWNPLDPKQDEEKRVFIIRRNSHTPSDIILRTAAENSGLDYAELMSLFPDHLSIYINPGEVYLKRSEQGTPVAIWIGRTDCDANYTPIPSYVGSLDNGNALSTPTTNMGAAGRLIVAPQLSPNVPDGVDAYFNLRLVDPHHRAIEVPGKRHENMKLFMFTSRHHRPFSIDEFSKTRFGSNRKRAEFDDVLTEKDEREDGVILPPPAFAQNKILKQKVLSLDGPLNSLDSSSTFSSNSSGSSPPPYNVAFASNRYHVPSVNNGYNVQTRPTQHSNIDYETLNNMNPHDRKKVISYLCMLENISASVPVSVQAAPHSMKVGRGCDARMNLKNNYYSFANSPELAVGRHNYYTTNQPRAQPRSLLDEDLVSGIPQLLLDKHMTVADMKF